MPAMKSISSQAVLKAKREWAVYLRLIGRNAATYPIRDVDPS